jgi:hypothetical protein
MSITPANIHVGAGTLTLNPDSEPITFDSTQDGATLSYSAEIEPIKVDQVLSPVGYFVPGEECTFEMMVVESDATTLQYALGATDQSVTTQTADASHKAYTEIKFGGNYTLTNYVLEYKARKRNQTNCYAVVRLYIVNLSPNLEAVYKKDGVTVYKLTFKAVADTTKSVGQQLGYYRNETSDVTGGTSTLAVSSSDPADAASGVAVDVGVIDIVFNRNVSPSSLIGGNFVLMTAAGVEHATTVGFTGDAGTNVTVTITGNLSGGTTYLLVISQNVRALDDNEPMAADVIIDFATSA